MNPSEPQDKMPNQDTQIVAEPIPAQGTLSNDQSTNNGQATPGRDMLQTMIPTKNMPSLLSYYFGFFAIIPFLGFPLSIAAIVLGITGLKKYNINPTDGAKSHAIVGIVLGIFWLLVHLGSIVAVITSM